MFGLDLQAVRAISRRDLRSQLGNPTGYVFLTLFMMTTAAAAFLQEEFFARNLADLALLNRAMPAILMLFVPAITMSAWAEERRAGTDELLLTLPVRDAEVVLGKYLGALGMFTASLGFSLIHLLVLFMLGAPDLGLMLSTYVGYWLMGALFVAVGLLGSMFAANTTVAFVLGGVGCAGLVFSATERWASGVVGVLLVALFSGLATWIVRGAPRGAWWAAAAGGAAAVAVWLVSASEGKPSWFAEAFEQVSVTRHFEAFGDGMWRLGDLVYFVGGTGVILYLCGLLIGRRHW